MSYDISFKVKVEGADVWVPVGDCDANITWNVREMIEASTGLPWLNEADNGLVKDVIPSILKGFEELTCRPGLYTKYEHPSGWGTVVGCKYFFLCIIKAWEAFTESYDTRDLVDVVHFWIE